MNWESLKEGLLLIGIGMTASVIVGIIATIIRDRYLQRKPEDDYTYVVKSKKGGKKTVVVLPPDLPETAQQDIMRVAYENLGLPPMVHYPVPMPRCESNLWLLRHHKTKAFKNGDSQAVRIPTEIAYDRPDIDLDIQRIGDELRIRPAQSQ
ncbi:hypothetical protein D0T23_11440 [Duganella sp. BJB475]|nr:hypothetical protein D0T23_11440 [Duganella sp. BJB475]RFP30961.1 hypothetical protein D0T21_13820 [Duganella sp. BJB476]